MTKTKTIEVLISRDYLNPYAPAAAAQLNAELVDYLCESAWYHPHLRLQIQCPADQQAQLGEAIGRTFTEKALRLKQAVALQRLEALVLLGLAILLVLGAQALEVKGTLAVGVVTITAWMLVWRAAEIFFLDIRSSQRDLRRCRRIADAPRQFV